MNNQIPNNPNIEVLKAGNNGLFTNYIYKAIPLAFDESMSYYETLLGLLNYLKNVVIPTLNNNANALVEVQKLFVQLKEYVDTYFTNLNVQNEINNKLDEMVKDGTLSIILNDELLQNINNKVLQNSQEIASIKTDVNNSVKQGQPNSITNDMLSQEVKESMTGGSVAVVGVDSVGNVNIQNNAISILKLNDNLQDNFNKEYENISLNFNLQGYCTITSQNAFNIQNDADYRYSIINLTKGNIYNFNVYDYINLIGLIIVDNNNNIVFSTEKNTNDVTPKNVVIEINQDNLKAYISRNNGSSNKWTNFIINSIIASKISKLSNSFITPNIELLKSIDGLYPNYLRNNVGDFIQTTTNPDSVINIYKLSKGVKYRVKGFDYIQSIGLVLTDEQYNITYQSSTTEVRPATQFIYEFTATNNGYAILTDFKNSSVSFTSSIEIIENNFLINKYNDKKWIAVGDSLTAKNTLGNNVDIYPDYIRKDLNINVENFGIGGTGYWRGNTSNNAFYQRINNIPTDADVITIFGSFNDLGVEGSITGKNIIGNVTDTGTNTLCGCINTTLDNLFNRCPKATVGIISPTPWWSSNSDYSHYGNDSVGNEYVNKLKEIAKLRSIPFLDLYTGSNLMPWLEQFRNLYYNNDGVHPNTKGQQRITPLIEEFLKSITY